MSLFQRLAQQADAFPGANRVNPEKLNLEDEDNHYRSSLFTVRFLNG
jgi:hypothetical protein